MTVIYIAIGLLLALAVFEVFFAGEKYFKWFLGQYNVDYEDFDLRKVKIIRGVSLLAVALLTSLYLLRDAAGKTVHHTLLLFIIMAIAILHFFVIMIFGKKK